MANDHFELCTDCWDKPGDFWGNHGYDNNLDAMKALFLGYGPDFKSNFEQNNLFRNVDLYPLMMELLHLQADPEYKHNGSFLFTREFLRNN